MNPLGIALAFVLLCCTFASAHPGRTDRFGCHVDQYGYHCHP